MKKKKVVIFTHYIPKFGGVETAIYEVARGLTERGHDVTIAFVNTESQLRLFHYAKVANVQRVLNSDPVIECDTCIIMLHSSKPQTIKADKWIKWIHSDYTKYNTPYIKEKIDEFVGVSSYVGEIAKKKYKIKQPITIHNYLSPDFREFKKPKIRFVTTTRLSDEKGFRFRNLKFAQKLEEAGIDYFWDIYGDNSMYRSIEERIKDTFREYPRVRFLGFRDDIREGLADADYYCLFSDWEGCPYGVIESLQMGTPCLVTNWGGADELIKEGENGYIFPMEFDITVKDIKKIVKNIPKVKPQQVTKITEWEKII
jgi:glycosyltransferase involved in cell wall biosynthesis